MVLFCTMSEVQVGDSTSAMLAKNLHFLQLLVKYVEHCIIVSLSRPQVYLIAESVKASA